MSTYKKIAAILGKENIFFACCSGRHRPFKRSQLVKTIGTELKSMENRNELENGRTTFSGTVNTHF